MRALRRWWLAAALASVGCDDSTGPDLGRTESDLRFVRFPATPPLQTLQASFWAVRGQSRELEIRYLPKSPGEDGEEFLEFRVPGDGLLRKPDGSSFATGDSIRITVTVSADGRFLFDFQPSGLQFDPRHPARLKITYRQVEDDLDGDGDVDGEDHDLNTRLGIWKQERPGDPWIPVGALRVEDFDEIEGEITGFTGFCLAG